MDDLKCLGTEGLLLHSQRFDMMSKDVRNIFQTSRPYSYSLFKMFHSMDNSKCLGTEGLLLHSQRFDMMGKKCNASHYCISLTKLLTDHHHAIASITFCIEKIHTTKLGASSEKN